MNSENAISLTEWIDSRVLVRVPAGHYLPGSIRAVHENRDLIILVSCLEQVSLKSNVLQLDDGEEFRVSDALNDGSTIHIIADQAPSASMVLSCPNNSNKRMLGEKQDDGVCASSLRGKCLSNC